MLSRPTRSLLSRINGIYTKIDAGAELDYDDANAFALEVGTVLSSAFKDAVSPDMFSDGIVYRDTAERFVMPMLETDYELISDVSAKVQTHLNKAAGLNLKAQRAEMNMERAQGIVTKVSSDTFDKTAWVLDESVVNFSQNVVDNYIRENADFQRRAGTQPIITRKMAGDCCDWCYALAGTYNYGEHPDDIFRRHRYCRCTVVFSPRKGVYQGVHSKRTYSNEHDAEISERIKKIQVDTKARAAEEKEKAVLRMANLAENKDAAWAKRVRQRQHIADWYAQQAKKKK